MADERFMLHYADRVEGFPYVIVDGAIDEDDQPLVPEDPMDLHEWLLEHNTVGCFALQDRAECICRLLNQFFMAMEVRDGLSNVLGPIIAKVAVETRRTSRNSSTSSTPLE